MNETLTNFRQAVADNADLQEKVKAGADLVALGKESGYEFTQAELETGWEELQKSDEELTAFELDVVAGGYGRGRRGC
ncbi:Nif11-like leader peptide family RiPP precursor [Akkermansiaceae bacterium]|nr:Nif11-like leader peptide family RiPP precursor [Akkermansiaceae bacterium]